MRTLRRNKRIMYYALRNPEQVSYVRDDEGNIIYDEIDGEQVPRESGNPAPAYLKPVQFLGNLSLSTGFDDPKNFGMDISEYQYLLSVSQNDIPIDETSILWCETTPTFLDNNKTIPNPSSADFRVRRVSPSINESRYVLQRLNHAD